MEDRELEKKTQAWLSSQNAQRFFEISPIHGCSYVGFRRSVYEGVFWMLILVCCSGFCINDIVILVNKFAGESTSISVVLQRNETLSFSQAAVCFDVFRRNLADSISSSFNETNFNKSLTVVAKRNRKQDIDLSILLPDDPDVDMVLKTAYLLIAEIVDYDLGTPEGGLANSGFIYDNSTLRAVELVESFFQERNFSYAQLYEQTARYMCYQMYDNAHSCPISLVGVNNSCVDICGVGRVNWVGNTMAFGSFDDICFALNTPGLQLFKSSADILVFEKLQVSRLSRLVRDWDEPTPSLLGYGSPHVLFDMRGWRALMDPRGMDSLAFVAAGTGFLVGAKIESYFIAYNHSWGTCGTLQMADCALLNCLPAVRMAADGCWPLAGYTMTLASKPANTSICSNRFSPELIRNVTSSYVGNWQKCVFCNCTFPPCNAYTYDFSESLTSTAARGVNATLYQGKLSYTVFEEYITMDFSAFLATLGGSLGLWFGGSLISILHIPVFTIFSLIYTRCKRPKQNTALAAQSEAVPAAMSVSKN